jgi:hypothetical protein
MAPWAGWHCQLVRSDERWSVGVTPGGDQNDQDIPVLINRPPSVVSLPVDCDEHLVRVPCVTGAGPTAAQPVGVGLAELPGPLADGVVGDRDASREHHFLDLPEAEREAGSTARHSG